MDKFNCYFWSSTLRRNIHCAYFYYYEYAMMSLARCEEKIILCRCFYKL